jgi:hypothetical protein
MPTRMLLAVPFLPEYIVTISMRITALLPFVALLPGLSVLAQAQSSESSDYTVYATVIREHFLRPPRGEHGLACEDDRPSPPLTVLSETIRLWQPRPPRDSAAAAELPIRIAPLVASLRALDTLPRRPLAADSFAVGRPVVLQRDSVIAPGPGSAAVARRAPTLIRFSRVAYGADRTKALVYAVRTCQEKPVSGEEAEEGAYGVALLVPLERRGIAWVILDPVYLHID